MGRDGASLLGGKAEGARAAQPGEGTLRGDPERGPCQCRSVPAGRAQGWTRLHLLRGARQWDEGQRAQTDAGKSQLNTRKNFSPQCR